MIIYKKDGSIFAEVLTTDNCERKHALMGDNYVSVDYVSADYIAVPADAYIVYEGKKFYLLAEYRPNDSDKGYSYKMKFNAIESTFAKYLFYYAPVTGKKEYDFRVSANLNTIATIVLKALQDCLPSIPWQIGDLKADTELVDLSFEGKTVLEAIQYIADQYKTEWWVEGNVLHFIRCESGQFEPLDSATMLSTVSVQEKKDILPQYLYAYGGTKNILPTNDGTANYGNRLQLPDGVKYVEVPGATTGASTIKFFDEVFPEIVGEITQVIYNNDDKNPIYYVNDSNRGFDLASQTIEGTVPRIRFASGRLNGREFDVQDTEKAVGNVPKGYMEVFRSEQEGVFLPRPSLEPRVGDKYLLYNILLPEAEKAKASQRLLAAAQAEALILSTQVPPITCESNQVYFSKNSTTYKVGQRVKLLHPNLKDGFVESRITEISYSLTSPYKFRFVIAQNLTAGKLAEIEKNLFQLTGSLGNADKRYHPLEGSVNIPMHVSDLIAKNVVSSREAVVQRDLYVGQKAIVQDKLQIGNFIGGLLGNGANIDGNGNAEMRSLKLWESLEVPELRYNRVSVSVGHNWQTNGGGIIESIEMLTEQTGIITLRLEEGMFGAVEVDDLCMGIWHNLNPSDNDADTSDDGKGNFTFAGFGTTYFRITEIIETTHNSQFSFTLRPLSEGYKKQSLPKSGMHFAQFGNPSNKARQSSVYSTTTYVRALRNVTTWEYSFANVAAQLYDCSNLSVFGRGDLADRSMYITNIYMTGTIEQFEIKPLTMSIDFSLGAFMAPNETGIATARVLDGYGRDVTDTMTRWQWTRESGDSLEDLAWNTAHKDTENILEITYADLGSNADTNIMTAFNVLATDEVKHVKGQLSL